MRPQAACLSHWLLRAGVEPSAEGGPALVARARRGNPSAFDALVRRHQSRLYNLSYRMLRDAQEAEDVTQEAFLKAFQDLPRLRDDAAFAAWLGRIAANLCLSRLRSPARRLELPTDPGLMPEAAEVRAEQMVGLHYAIQQLPAKYRLAVVAFYLEGRSYEEAARLVGVPVRTLKTQLYRARQRLRDLLRETEP